MDEHDAELDAHGRRKGDGINGRDVQPAQLPWTGDGLEDYMAVRVIVVRCVIQNERRRMSVGWRRDGIRAVLVLMLVREMRVHEPVRHRKHGSRKASEQRNNEGQQADGQGTVHTGIYSWAASPAARKRTVPQSRRRAGARGGLVRVWRSRGPQPLLGGTKAQPMLMSQMLSLMPSPLALVRVPTTTMLIAALTLPGPKAALAQNAPALPANGGPSWAAVQQVLGGKGMMQPGEVLRFGFPRTDLHVTAAGVQIEPGFALGSWVAFKRMGQGANAEAMVMGDLVLTEDELNPVMLALQRGGVQQTAVHNHVLDESPRVMYMHVSAHGDPVEIAQTIRTALGASRTPLPTSAGRAGDKAEAGGAATPAASPLDLDTAAVARTLGVAGRANGGIYQVSVPRSERITDHGMEVPPSMGLATAINFQPTGGGKAAITGDFVMTAAEVNPVIRALRENGIQVTALHSHMLEESPRLFFMHFWANDDAATLAKGLRAALDRTASKRP